LASSLFSFARLSIERRGGVSVRGGRGVRMAAPAIALEVGAPTTESGEAETRDAPREDPFGLDPGLRRRVLPAARFLHDRYWRIEVTGIRHVPTSGPALLVANHSGAIPFDGAMIVTAVELRCQRTLRFLYDRFVENLAPVATFYDKMGGAVATRENAVARLKAGELLLVFPEGVPGVAGALPLPAKWFSRFGKPIRLEAQEVEARWQRARQEATRVRRTIQEMVVRLKRRRRSVFFG